MERGTLLISKQETAYTEKAKNVAKRTKRG